MTTQTQAGPYQYVQSIRLPVLTALLDALPAAKKLFDEGYVYEAFVMLNDVERIEPARRAHTLIFINSPATIAGEFPLFRPAGEMNVYTSKGR